jgi:hypothetical protein
MLINLYDAEYAHTEHERRVQAHLLERAIREASATRTRPMTQRIDQVLRLAVRWVTTTRCWGWNPLQQLQG